LAKLIMKIPGQLAMLFLGGIQQPLGKVAHFLFGAQPNLHLFEEGALPEKVEDRDKGHNQGKDVGKTFDQVRFVMQPSNKFGNGNHQ
jgi:hypothetical protein